MKKILLTMLLLAIVAGVSYAEYWICDGTAMLDNTTPIGEGWKVTVKYFTYCTSITTATGYFYVSSTKPILQSTDLFLVFSKSGEKNLYSNWFSYTVGVVSHLGTFIVRNAPPLPQR